MFTKSLNAFYCNSARSSYEWNINFLLAEEKYFAIHDEQKPCSCTAHKKIDFRWTFSKSRLLTSFAVTFLKRFYGKSCRSSPWFLASFSRLVLNIWKGRYSSYRESKPGLHGQAKVEPNLARKASRPWPACTMTSRRRMSQSATRLFSTPCCLQRSQCYLCVLWQHLVPVEHSLPGFCSWEDCDMQRPFSKLALYGKSCSRRKS